MPLADGVTVDPPDFGREVSVKTEAVKQLQGIRIDFPILVLEKHAGRRGTVQVIRLRVSAGPARLVFSLGGRGRE